MTAEPTSDALERASAYVEGALAPHERLEIEGSAELMGWVAALAAVRADLAVVQPATTAQRDQAIDAALAELEPAAVPATQSPHDAIVRVMPRRSRWVAVMGSAAAAVVLVVVGINVVRSSDSDTDLATPAELAADTVAPAGADARTSTEDAAAGGAAAEDAPATLGAITGPATVLPAVDTAEQLQAYAGESPKVATYDTESTTESTTEASIAGDVAAATSRIVVPPPPCVPADATVIGSVTVAGTTATVIQTPDGQLQALDGACAVLLTAAP